MGKNPTVITEKPAGIFLKHSAIVWQDQPHQGKNLLQPSPLFGCRISFTILTSCVKPGYPSDSGKAGSHHPRAGKRGSCTSQALTWDHACPCMDPSNALFLFDSLATKGSNSQPSPPADSWSHGQSWELWHWCHSGLDSKSEDTIYKVFVYKRLRSLLKWELPQQAYETDKSWEDVAGWEHLASKK